MDNEKAEETQEKMNQDFPAPRGCWLELKGEDRKKPDSVVLHDYPSWRAEHGPELPAWNRNEPIPEGKPRTKEFRSVADAEAFMKAENYVRCDMPAALKPKRPQQARSPKADFLANL